MMNGKNSYYFSHDSNARNDEKILMLRAEHGWEGYGIFWVMVEMMFENTNTQLQHNKIRGLSVSYNIDITLLENVIKTCINEGLFVSDGTFFWSESLLNRKALFQESKNKRSEAGKKGMASRWKGHVSKGSDNNVITKDNKERKVKERKVKSNGKFTPPSLDEVVSYFKEKGYSIESGKKAFEYYNVGDWIDSTGKKVKNWKQKMQGVWFKPENKSTASKPLVPEIK